MSFAVCTGRCCSCQAGQWIQEHRVAQKLTSLWEGKRRASSDLPPKSSKAKSEYAITCSTAAQPACVGP